MGKQRNLACLLSFFFLLLSFGCSKKIHDFSFSYTMESVGSYKLVVSFDSNSNYKIEEYHYFFDNFENKKRPVIREGVLTEKELDEIRARLTKADLFKMDDTYGFDRNEQPDSDIIYQLFLRSGDVDKYITLQGDAAVKFPASFLQLIDYINTFLKAHKTETQKEAAPKPE